MLYPEVKEINVHVQTVCTRPSPPPILEGFGTNDAVARVSAVLPVTQLSSYVHCGPSSEAPAQTRKGVHPDDECACPPDEDVLAMLTSYCTCVYDAYCCSSL